MRRTGFVTALALSTLLVACGGGDSSSESGGESASSSGATAERATIVAEMTAWIQTLDVEIADPVALEACVAELSDDDARIIAANVAAEFAGLENGEITDYEALGVSEDGRYSYAGAMLCR